MHTFSKPRTCLIRELCICNTAYNVLDILPNNCGRVMELSYGWHSDSSGSCGGRGHSRRLGRKIGQRLNAAHVLKSSSSDCLERTDRQWSRFPCVCSCIWAEHIRDKITLGAMRLKPEAERPETQSDRQTASNQLCRCGDGEGGKGSPWGSPGYAARPVLVPLSVNLGIVGDF